MAPTIPKPVHVKTTAKCDKFTATISSAEIHITCQIDEQTDIIHNKSEKTGVFLCLLMSSFLLCQTFLAIFLK